MRKWIIVIVMVMVANVSLVCGETPVEKGIVGSAVVESSPAGAEEKEGAGGFAIFPRRGLADRPAESAEAAEDLAAGERRSSRLWVRAELLVWWIKTAKLPPLVTTGSLTNPRPGALGSSATGVLFGQSRSEER